MLPSRSGRSLLRRGAAGLFLICAATLAAQSQTPTPTPGSLVNVPLPVGQEVKGLVLPDFDLQGRLRARFEAGVAKRIDAEHIAFTGLKMTTFTPQSAIDLLIDMPASTLDLKTRVITSQTRTTVQRADFNISGDRMEFDTVARKGTMRGNVRMVITEQSDVMKKPGE